VGLVIGLLIIVAFLVLLFKRYKKVPQGKALVRNGIGGTLVRFTGMFVVPIFHRVELMTSRSSESRSIAAAPTG
jgi:uncharacterized membrane protein YqiK